MKENIITEKTKRPLIITVIIGVVSIIIGISVYLTLYLNTKNYTLLKNNVDIYERSKTESVAQNDYVYFLKDDTEYFTLSEHGCSIHIDKVKANNPDYLKNDYFIELQFSFDIVDTLTTNQYAEISIKSNLENDKKVIKTVAGRVNSESLYFDDKVTNFEIECSGKENAEMFKISAMAFKFYSYVR